MKDKDYYRPKIYWDKHFDFKEEFMIYQYLCGNLKKKRTRKKVKEKFIYYKDWKHYVKEKYKEMDEQLLQEFLRYLNTKKRWEASETERISIIWIPFLIVVITRTLEEYLKIIKEPLNYWNDLVRSFEKAFTAEGIVERIFAVILVCASTFIVVLLFLVMPIYLFFILFQIDKQRAHASQRNALIEDYQEIIREILKEKQDIVKDVKTNTIAR